MCEIVRKGFLRPLSDNDEAFLQHLIAICESVDEYLCMEINKNPYSYSFRIAPSAPKYNNSLIQEILKFHNLFKLKINMSKSIKTSGTLAFEIDIKTNEYEV